MYCMCDTKKYACECLVGHMLSIIRVMYKRVMQTCLHGHIVLDWNALTATLVSYYIRTDGINWAVLLVIAPLTDVI